MLPRMASAPDDSAAADFARRFAEYWQAPTPEGLANVLAPDVRLVGPMLPVTHTLAEGQQAFADLLELIPDLTEADSQLVSRVVSSAPPICSVDGTQPAARPG